MQIDELNRNSNLNIQRIIFQKLMGSDQSKETEKYLLDNPVNDHWLELATKVADTLNSSPYSYFESSDLKVIEEKLDKACNSGAKFQYSQEHMIKIKNTFKNTFLFRMRDC